MARDEAEDSSCVISPNCAARTLWSLQGFTHCFFARATVAYPFGLVVRMAKAARFAGA